MREVQPDYYDETRHAWLREHPFTNIQKRRAQLLNQQIGRRKRHAAGAGTDPADDNVIGPLWIRKPTPAEAVIIGAAAALAPLGWPLGVLIYRRTVNLISAELPSYPVAVLLWSAFGTGVLTVLLYWPNGSLLTTLAAPWLIAQIPAAFAAAAIYGILNGWLAVSAGWWPTQPPPMTSELARGLGLGHHDTRTQSTRPILWGLTGCLLGAVWMIGGVIATILAGHS